MECNIRLCPNRRFCHLKDSAEDCSLYKQWHDVQDDVDRARLEQRADQTRAMDMYEKGLGTW